MTSARVLCLDIETKPAKAYVWSLFNVNISLNQLIEPSAPICFAAKWLGEKETMFHSDWQDGHETMIQKAHEYLSEADAVISYNGDGFDLRKLQGEFVLAGLTPPPPPTSIDLLKQVKKLGIQSNKLAFVGPFFKIGKKVENEGFSLWTKVEAGDEAARGRMEKYCRGDVILTEKVYELLKPYIYNHPTLTDTPDACGVCESTKAQKRGFTYTKAYKTQRLQCKDCGSWRSGTKTKL